MTIVPVRSKNILSLVRKKSNKSTENDSASLTNLMSKMEEKYIREAIDSFPYNLSKAAAYLGISRQALQYKMKKYNIKY